MHCVGVYQHLKSIKECEFVILFIPVYACRLTGPVASDVSVNS